LQAAAMCMLKTAATASPAKQRPDGCSQTSVLANGFGDNAAVAT